MKLAGCGWFLALSLFLSSLVSPSLPSAVHLFHDTVSEELLIRPLDDGSVFVHWHFTTRGDLTGNRGHYKLLPKTLGQVLNKFSVEELHLTLTQGRWDYQYWGSPLMSAPVGAEFWAWLQSSDGTGASKSVEERWKGLTHALSGLFCSSLNLMDEKVTAKPLHAFTPEGSVSNSSALRYGRLPREPVCTENLTPWSNLLPCRTEAGLGSLFDSLRQAASLYRSMATHVRTVPQANCNGCRTIELVHTIALVLDRDGPFSQRTQSNRAWRLSSLFGKALKRPCPLVHKSVIYVDTQVPDRIGSPNELSPSPDYVIKSSDPINPFTLAAYDLHLHNFSLELDVSMSWTFPFVETAAEYYMKRERAKDMLYIKRHATEDDKLEVSLWNGLAEPASVLYFDSVPWYIKLYFHTLALRVNNTQTPLSQVVDLHHFVPSEDRWSPSMLEISMQLAPQTLMTFVIDFERAYLHYTEYPPDPHRGFDIGSAVLTHFQRHSTATYTVTTNHSNASSPFSTALISLIAQSRAEAKRIYSGGVLVSLPTPDFSMPYNVLTFSGAVVAIFFASMFKLLTSPPERLGLIEVASGQSFLERLRGMLRRLWGFLLFWKRKRD